mgnify:FL=1|jgi:hypothetical protein
MITIKNYNSDVGHATFYGWDMKYALEDKDFYSFEFEHRNEQKRVYVLVHRNSKKRTKHVVSEDLHEVYIQDMVSDKWRRTLNLTKPQLNKSAFYNWVESVIDDEYPLPF